MKHIKAIVNVDNNWAIGKNGNLINKFPEDFNFFKEKTKNSIIICGRNTFNEMGPLNGRIVIVLTSNKNNLNSDMLKKADYYDVFEGVNSTMHIGPNIYGRRTDCPDISKFKKPVLIIENTVFISTVIYAIYLKKRYENINDIYICGGYTLYKEVDNFCDEVFITKCNNTIEGADKFFPIQKFRYKYLYIKGDSKISKTGIEYSFDTLKRKEFYYDR